jgi:hypothetical protein
VNAGKKFQVAKVESRTRDQTAGCTWITSTTRIITTAITRVAASVKWSRFVIDNFTIAPLHNWYLDDGRFSYLAKYLCSDSMLVAWHITRCGALLRQKAKNGWSHRITMNMPSG